MSAALSTRPPFGQDPFGYATHEVLNQAPPLADFDAYGTDLALRDIVRVFGADWAAPRLHETGRTVGSAHVQDLARAANRVLPELRTHDRFGNRVDRIDFHPAWHELMGLAIGQGAVSLAWTGEGESAQVAAGPSSTSGTRARRASAARSR